MQTFSCAVQTVDVKGVKVSFEIDPNDHGVCCCVVDGWRLTFQRNGKLLSIAEPQPEPAPEAKAEETHKRRRHSED